MAKYYLKSGGLQELWLDTLVYEIKHMGGQDAVLEGLGNWYHGRSENKLTVNFKYEPPITFNRERFIEILNEMVGMSTVTINELWTKLIPF